MWIASPSLRRVSAFRRKPVADHPIGDPRDLNNTKFITAGYNFLAQDPLTGAFLLNGSGNPIPTPGTEGILTAHYGAPRQVVLSLGINF
jgi:hypothetical protein